MRRVSYARRALSAMSTLIGLMTYAILLKAIHWRMMINGSFSKDIDDSNATKKKHK